MINNNPQVITTGEKNKPNKKWFQTWRIIYPILGIVVIVELIWGLKTLLTPLPKSPAQVQKVSPISGAQIFLLSSKTTYKIGDQIPVTVKISTGGHTTSGTDLILTFDPKVLEVSPTAFNRGKIYNDYPLVSSDSKAGIVRISGVVSTAKGAFGGIGELGVINFKAKASGETALTVDFKRGQTNDSNVISIKTNEDILEKVSNLSILIK